MEQEQLSIEVDVAIGDALASLNELQEELQDLAEQIEAVDAIGDDGIDINARLESIDEELATTATKVEAFEESQSVDIPVYMNDKSFDTILEQAGAGSVAELRGDYQDDLLASVQGANLDFGEFNAERGAENNRTARGPNRRDRLVRRASRVSDSITDMLPSIDSFGARMSDMHNLMATFIPMLITLIGAMPAAIAAFYTLASAGYAAAASLASIVGFGALGVALQDGQFSMQRLTDVWNRVQNSFIEAFAPLAERLQPLFMDAVDALDVFFQRIANQGDALMAFTDEARAFGGWLMDFVPTMLRTMSALTNAFSGLFADAGRWLQDNLVSSFSRLVGVTSEVIPTLVRLVGVIGNALPSIIQISSGFMEVTYWIVTALGAISRLLGILGVSPKIFGIVVGSLLSIYTALSLVNFMSNTLVASGLARLVAWLAEVIAINYYGASSFAVLAASEALAARALALLITTATVLLGIGLFAWVSSQAADFLGLADSIQQSTDAMKEFNKVSNRGGTSGVNPYGGDGQDGGGGYGGGTGGGGATMNMESSGDPEEDASNARYATWRLGRTTGKNN